MGLYGGIELPDRPDPENVRKLDLLPIPMVRSIMRYGFRIDPDHFRALSSRLTARMAELRADITNEIPAEALDRFLEVSGGFDRGDEETDDDGSFNVESSSDVARLLYETLHLDRVSGVKVKKTKGGDRLSTGKKTLEQLKREHPVVPLILEYRENSKLESTYARSMPRRARWHPKGADCPECGRHHWTDEWRVHTSILTTRTATGRLASKNPNLQNIPARSELGREIRAGFIASEGHIIAQRDFAQVELRLGADRSGETNMLRIFADDGDIHMDTAVRAFNLPVEKLDKLMHRAPCKNVNFAVCIARGQKVLTDRGLVAIEDVSCDDKVWDGEEFVFHRGVVFQGLRKVITHDGLTATPDHKVWLEDGTTTTLEGAKSTKRRLAHTEIGGTPIRFSEFDLERNPPTRTQKGEVRFSPMWGVWQHQRSVSEQLAFEKDYKLYVQESVPRSTFPDAAQEVLCDPPAVQQPKVRVLSRLRRAWDRLRVRIGQRFPRFRPEEVAPPDIQESGHREEEQQRELLQGEHPTGEPDEKLTQHALKQVRFVSGKLGYSRGIVRAPRRRLPRVPIKQDQDCQIGITWNTVAGDPNPDPTEALEAPVYDILNAGPRRRFTVSGRLVSNCYGITEDGLLDLMADTYSKSGVKMPDWMDKKWCFDFIEKWFSLYPGMRQYLNDEESKARRYGIVWTATGRVRRIPEVRSYHSHIQSAGVRQGCNHSIQGFSADLMRLAMGEVDDRLKVLAEYGIDATPLMSVHDELLIETPEEHGDTIQALLGEVFGNVLFCRSTGRNLCRVPIKSDGKLMERWLKE